MPPAPRPTHHQTTQEGAHARGPGREICGTKQAAEKQGGGQAHARGHQQHKGRGRKEASSSCLLAACLWVTRGHAHPGEGGGESESACGGLARGGVGVPGAAVRAPGEDEGALQGECAWLGLPTSVVKMRRRDQGPPKRRHAKTHGAGPPKKEAEGLVVVWGVVVVVQGARKARLSQCILTVDGSMLEQKGRRVPRPPSLSFRPSHAERGGKKTRTRGATVPDTGQWGHYPTMTPQGHRGGEKTKEPRGQEKERSKVDRSIGEEEEPAQLGRDDVATCPTFPGEGAKARTARRSLFLRSRSWDAGLLGACGGLLWPLLIVVGVPGGLPVQGLGNGAGKKRLRFLGGLERGTTAQPIKIPSFFPSFFWLSATSQATTPTTSALL